MVYVNSFFFPCYYWEILTGLPCFFHVGGGELITDGGVLHPHHGHQLFAGAQHQSLFGPLRWHQGHAAEPDAAPCLLEATVPLTLRFHQPLIRGRGECTRGQGVRGVFRSGPLCLGGLVDQLSARDANQTLTIPWNLQGNPRICGTLIPLNSKRRRQRELFLYIQACQGGLWTIYKLNVHSGFKSDLKLALSFFFCKVATIYNWQINPQTLVYQ